MARRRIEEEMRGDLSSAAGFEKASDLKKVEFEKNRDGVFCLQFSFDGSMLAVGHGNGGVTVYDSKTFQKIGEPKVSRYGAYPTLCIKWHPTDKNVFLSGDAEGNVHSCDARTKESTKLFSENFNQINTMDFSADGYFFATAGKDKTVRVYETKNPKTTYKEYTGTTSLPVEDDDGVLQTQVTAINDDGVGPHHQRIFSLKWHPGKDDIFLTAGWDDGIKVWNVKSNEVRRTICGDKLPRICGDGLDVLKDNLILTGSWVGVNALQLWEYTSGELVKTIPFPSTSFVEVRDNNNSMKKTGATKGAFLYCAQFVDNDCVLAGGSGTNSVLAINSESGKCLGEVKMTHVVQAMDSTAGGRLFAVGGGDRYFKFGQLA